MNVMLVRYERLLDPFRIAYAVEHFFLLLFNNVFLAFYSVLLHFDDAVLSLIDAQAPKSDDRQ